MVNYPNYLIEKIRISNDSEKEPFPHKQEFRLALHEIYFFKNHKKLGELVDILTNYYLKKENSTDLSKAFKKSLTNLEDFSRGTDRFYNFKNKEIQKFFKNSIENFYSFKDKEIKEFYKDPMRNSYKIKLWIFKN